MPRKTSLTFLSRGHTLTKLAVEEAAEEALTLGDRARINGDFLVGEDARRIVRYQGAGHVRADDTFRVLEGIGYAWAAAAGAVSVGGDELCKVVTQQGIRALLDGWPVVSCESGGCHLGEDASLGQSVHLVGVGLDGGVALRVGEDRDISRKLQSEESLIGVG